MQPSIFDVISRRKSISVFKLDNLWVFKHSSMTRSFGALLDYYNKNLLDVTYWHIEEDRPRGLVEA